MFVCIYIKYYLYVHCLKTDTGLGMKTNLKMKMLTKIYQVCFSYITSSHLVLVIWAPRAEMRPTQLQAQSHLSGMTTDQASLSLSTILQSTPPSK